MLQRTDDIRIKWTKVVLPPVFLEEEMPMTERASSTIFQARAEISNILQGKDHRLLVVLGPCSIHDTKAAREYAALLKTAIAELSADLRIVMRVYFEKPRTTIGWKGLINDPHLDQSFKINDGLRLARRLLLDLAEMGVSAGTEFLDMIIPQYLASLVSWGAIGARTTESQVHRELVSGSTERPAPNDAVGDPTGAPEKSLALFHVLLKTGIARLDLRTTSEQISYDAGPDGKWFVVNSPPIGTPPPITLITNWAPEPGK